MEKFTADVPFKKKIKISQPGTGYRYSLDPFILADQVCLTGNEKIIDVGCGCGIISLLLAQRHPETTIYGIEIQKELAGFAKKNAKENNLNQIISILEADINKITTGHINGKADIIIANPPYKKKGTGRLNPGSQKAIARHEITLDLYQLFECSQRLLNNNGFIYLIFPSERIQDIIFAMDKVNFGLNSLKFIHVKPDDAAKHVVVCAKKHFKGPCTISPPFYLYNSKNQFSDEYYSLFRVG